MLPGDPNSNANRGRKPRGNGTLPYAPDLTEGSRREREIANLERVCREGKRLKPPARKRP